MKQIDIEQVEKIELEIGPVASTAAAIKDPKIGVEGKFSVWFLAALALAEGNISQDKFTDEKVNQPDLIRLRKKISTKLDPVIGFGARYCITMKDGTIYQDYLAKPKGDPDNPLSFEELADKYRRAAALALPKTKIETLINTIKELQQVKDMGEIMALGKI